MQLAHLPLRPQAPVLLRQPPCVTSRLQAPPAAPVVRPRTAPRSKQFVDTRRQATLSLPEWLKRHRCLKACTLATGEASVALLLLWEADHGTTFPSRSVDLTGRLSTFTKRLKDAVAVDPELQHWLSWQLMPFSLAPGLPCRVHIRWAVRIDSSVGEPFLGMWKAHILEQFRLHREASLSGARTRVSRLPRAPATSSKGRKRKQEGAPGVWVPPPSQNAQARVERLAKARRLMADGTTGAMASSSSSSSGGQPSSSSSSSSVETGSGLLPPGVLT